MNLRVISCAIFALFTTILSYADAAKVVINMKDGSSKSSLLVRADKAKVFYIDNVNDTTESAISRDNIESIFFYRPSSFHKGLESYKLGKFNEAKAAFQTCKKEYQGLKILLGNYSVLASFYEMECARRSGDLESLDKLLDSFRPEALINENFINQLSIYPFWNAVKSRSWDKMLLLAKQWDKKKLPAYQRAQVSYCHALALQAKGEEEESLLKFNEVLALSNLKEVDLVENACEKIIDTILAKPGTMDVKKKLRTDKAKKNSTAYYQLLEAASVARLWNNLTNQTRKLPSKYKDLLEITP